MSRPALLAALFAGAAAISGFTILQGGAPFDEGIVLQAARRVAGGQVVYRDFDWAYGPLQPYLLGGWFEAFGPSLRRDEPSGSRLLDEWAADAYRPEARYGDYEVLVPRRRG